MIYSHCATCGGELHPISEHARRRLKFCSERCRKAQYAGTCEDCGKRTSGTDGRDKAPKLCRTCSAARRRKWTRETIAAALRTYAERYGRRPVVTDFNPAAAAWRGSHDVALKRERFYGDGDYPHTATILDVFGSWNAAIEAAGFKPIPVGHWEMAR